LSSRKSCYTKKTQIKSQYFFVNFLLSSLSLQLSKKTSIHSENRNLFPWKMGSICKQIWPHFYPKKQTIHNQKKKKKDVFAVLVRVQQNKTPIA